VYVGFPADHPAVNKSRPFQAVTAASLLIPRRLFEVVGGFDTSFVNSYEDVDLCLRLGQQGYECHYCHESVLYHLESVTREHRTQEDEYNAQVYYRRWGHRVQPDDVRYYWEDGLLAVERADGVPARVVMSPYLAFSRAAADGVRPDGLIAQRSQQLFELLKENVRLNVAIKEAELAAAAHSGAGGPAGDEGKRRASGAAGTGVG
jgi:hypothetical protein